MKIKSLKINQFGNLKEKEINFSDHINIVQGKNESGKSTLLKFIANIFYGTSKNKKGKQFSDYDKYKPWGQEEFSGKLIYTLDDGMQYEVFRDFNKKNPTIYNQQLEDISKQFTIDKTYGNQFFVEQTKIEENVFYSTFVSMQQEVKLEQNVQNTMVQKVANLAGTGDDNISYKKAMEKINKKQIEEIGSTRSQGRPVNVIKEEKFKIQDELGELEEAKQTKQKIIQQKQEKQEELIKIEQELQVIKKVKEIKEKQKLEEEKLQINIKIKQSEEQRKKQLEEENEELKNKEEQITEEKSEKQSKKISSLVCIVISILLEIISIIFIKNTLYIGIFAFSIVIAIAYYLLQIRKQNQKKRQEEQRKRRKIEDTKIKIETLQAQIISLKNNIEEQEKEIKNKKEAIYFKENVEKEKLKETLKDVTILNKLFETDNLQQRLEEKQEEANRKKLEYHSLELEENTISPKLEKIALLEEKLDEIVQREKELEKYNSAIELTKQILESAYQKMKQNVTPKLTQELSKNIEEISNGKYTKVSLNEENGLIVEKQNGEYIEAEKLSIRHNRTIIFIFAFSHGRRINQGNYANYFR